MQDLTTIKQLKQQEFSKLYPWFRRSHCAIIKDDEFGIPIEWTLKPRYAKNTVCFEGKDMKVEYAIAILDNRILNSIDPEERMNAESTRFTIFLLANDFNPCFA